jgi:mRNA interferase MazF
MRLIRVRCVGSNKPFQRADVVKHPAPFKNPPTDRFFVIINDSSHPFHGQEYAVVALTSKQRPETIEITPSDWRFGGPSGNSYASPWYVLTIKHADITNAQGSVTASMADTIASETASYLGV